MNREKNERKNLQQGTNNLDDLATKIDLHLKEALKNNNAEGSSHEDKEK